MQRVSYAIFAIIAYLVFLATFLYLIGFVAGAPFLPTSIDHPASALPLAPAAIVDLMLVGVFGLQHSIMARSGFKAAWTRVMPPPVERSGYMIFSCLALILIFALWQPLPALLWDVRSTPAAIAIWALFGAGWLIVLLSTFLISHFELFGLKQVWNHWRGHDAVAPTFRQPFFYKLVRHPLYSGFLLAFYATPAMTLGHMVFAAAMTVYIQAAIRFEERDLIKLFGADYETYRGNVGKLAPRLRRGTM